MSSALMRRAQRLQLLARAAQGRQRQGQRQRPQGLQLRAASDRAAGMEALGIELTLARAALERRDTAAFRAALARADGWLPRLWPDSPALREQRKQLQALQAQSLAFASPVVGTTLAQLRSMRAH